MKAGMSPVAFILINQILAAPANVRFLLLVLQGHPEISVVAELLSLSMGPGTHTFFAHSFHTSVCK